MPPGRALPPDEAERIAAVHRYAVLDTPPEDALDRIVALAAALFDVRFAVVSIVDTDRIWFKARHGLDVTQIDRSPGLCGSAIFGTGPYVVADALLDPRTQANPLVTGELGLRFYAGVPLTTPAGLTLGTLCVFGTEPRRVTEDEIRVLAHLADRVVQELEVRRGHPVRTSGVNTEHVDVRELLGVYVLGACEPGTAVCVERHLAVCTACATVEAELRETASWIGGVEAVEPPEDLRRRISERLDRDVADDS
jgi:signal transduction protein with GAF and PtsI domain